MFKVDFNGYRFNVDYEIQESLQEEIDSFLVMANMIGYEIKYMKLPNSFFVSCDIGNRTVVSIQVVNDLQDNIHCIEICATGEKFKLAREKTKDGNLRFRKNYVKAIRISKELL